jgi:hypothetical protein
LQPLKWENWQRVRSRSLALQKNNNGPERKKTKNQETKTTKTKNPKNKNTKKTRLHTPRGEYIVAEGGGSCHFLVFF